MSQPDHDEPDTLNLYLSRLRPHPVLSRDRTVCLARQIREFDQALWGVVLDHRAAGRIARARLRRLPGYPGGRDLAGWARANDLDQVVLRAVLAEVGQIDRLQHAEFFVELARAQRQRDGARTAFVNANLRLVVSIAKAYLGRGVAFEDLIQEGNLGLLRAVDRYDPDRQIAFTTYGIWWIKHAIGRAIDDRGREVRVPVHWQEKLRHVRSSISTLIERGGAAPSVGEIAEHAGMTVPRVQMLLTLIGSNIVSMDTPMLDEPEHTIGDTFVADLTPADELAILGERSDRARTLIGMLPPRLRDILERRFGFRGDGMTLAAVAEQDGLTRERIRQLEAQALRKLRRIARLRNLTP